MTILVARAGRAVAVVLVMVSAACSERAPFDPVPVDAVVDAIVRNGVEVCDERRVGAHANQSLGGVNLLVAEDCTESRSREDATTVVIDEYEDRDQRDAAARNVVLAARPRTHGTVWTYGRLTIAISGPRDGTVVDRVTQALDGLGAR